MTLHDLALNCATMLIMTLAGLYCPIGRFYIDPSRGVENAVVTHAHADHARRGSQKYYCCTAGTTLLKARLGSKIDVIDFSYGQKFSINGVTISFHSAGHILGSSQVRLQIGDEVWVVSGDYKREKDPTCEPFEVVPCDVFVTEATFGTPAFQWKPQPEIGLEIFSWWQQNSKYGKNSVILAYSLGKTQRILGELHSLTNQAVYCHAAARAINLCYRAQGVKLAPTICLSEVLSEDPNKVPTDRILTGELFIVPPSFIKTEAARILGSDYATAFASGWTAQQRNSHFDRGFVMSDHADWNDLVRTCLETGAKKIFVQHRGQGALVRHLRSLGIQAFSDQELVQKNSDQLMLF